MTEGVITIPPYQGRDDVKEVTERSSDIPFEVFCFLRMPEDVMTILPSVGTEDAEEVAESFSEVIVDSEDFPTVNHCNGAGESHTNDPAELDGMGYRRNEFASASKRNRFDRCCTELSNERVLSIVAKHTNWNPVFICFLSCLCQKTKAISDRHLWREFCHSRAPKMVSDLLLDARHRQIHGGWRALGKVFLYCAGCSRSSLGSGFPMQAVAGHFVPQTRFSRTSGRFFLIPRCRRDVLYMSDPCEHANEPEDVGLFRGVFRSFDKSETKKLLTSHRVPLSEAEHCPFCKAGVWNMRHAKMIPKSASKRLAAHNQIVEYSVCLNGHVNGKCALVHLSESDDSGED